MLSILKKGEDHPAHDKAQTMVDKGGEKKPTKKTRVSPKQKLIKLCEEHDWLAYDNERGHEYFKCEVWDIREDENRDLYFDEMTDHSDSWKMAYQYALELVERNTQYGKTYSHNW